MIIYKISNSINNKVYIGITTQHFYIRKSQHKYIAEKTNDKRPLYQAIRKYGIEFFNFEIIDYAESLEDLNNKEIYYINKYKSIDKNFGYNIDIGGGLSLFDRVKADEHPQAILSNSEVIDIVDVLKNTNISQKEIAKVYNISSSTINAINYGKAWKSIISSEKFPIREYATKKKLDKIDVLKIIDDLINTSISFYKLAEKYSVSRETIKSICYCKSWTDLHKYKKHIRNGI
jgi:group I intron endonuclease